MISLSRFALRLWRARPRFDRQDGHCHRNGSLSTRETGVFVMRFCSSALTLSDARHGNRCLRPAALGEGR